MKMLMKTCLIKLAALLILACGDFGWSHDTWVQTTSLAARSQDVSYVDLMLGNHGNGHRDFKLASKISFEPWTLQVVGPDGGVIDIKDTSVDTGYTAKEGYWSCRFVLDKPGVYQLVHLLDTLHGKTRAVKTSRTFVVAADQNNDFQEDGVQKYASGKYLEFVLLTPVTAIKQDREIQLELRQHGKPVPDQLVTFIPRGKVLAESFDPKYEVKSDSNGIVRFVPDEANLFLIVSHLPAPNESGNGYEKTHYSATVVLPVPVRSIVE